jgi:hypothetical protein
MGFASSSGVGCGLKASQEAAAACPSPASVWAVPCVSPITHLYLVPQLAGRAAVDGCSGNQSYTCFKCTHNILLLSSLTVCVHKPMWLVSQHSRHPDQTPLPCAAGSRSCRPSTGSP